MYGGVSTVWVSYQLLLTSILMMSCILFVKSVGEAMLWAKVIAVALPIMLFLTFIVLFIARVVKNAKTIRKERDNE